MDIRLYVLLVIYNRRCEDSPSCEALRAMPDVRAVVVDNSTVPNDNARYCARRGFGYTPMGGNKGLAKAYNHGIAWIKKNTTATHVLLLDDDTAVSDGFIDAMCEAAKRHPEHAIVLPRVYDEKGLLSPCAIDGFRVSRIADPDELTPSSITAINSGMMIDMKIFKEYAYDERYFLDYIDHAFMRDMKASGVSFVVTKERLQQRFSGNERANTKAARTRFHIFKSDFRRFCGRSFKGRLTATATIWRRRIKIWLSR